MASIELWWLPLGAGGRFVRLNGRVYEALHALWERRRPRPGWRAGLVAARRRASGRVSAGAG